MAPHSSALAWKIPWTEEPGRLQSMGSLGVGHDWVTSLSLFTFMHGRRKWQPTPVFLPGESQGLGEPGGLPSLGSHTVRHDWSNLAAAVERGDRESVKAGPKYHSLSPSSLGQVMPQVRGTLSFFLFFFFIVAVLFSHIFSKLLKYGWFSVFQVNSKMIQLYWIYM